MVKCLPAMQETWIRSLGWDDPLEEEMAAHSSILVWKIPWTRKPGRLQSMGCKESDMTEWLHFCFLETEGFPSSCAKTNISHAPQVGACHRRVLSKLMAPEGKIPVRPGRPAGSKGLVWMRRWVAGLALRVDEVWHQSCVCVSLITVFITATLMEN